VTIVANEVDAVEQVATAIRAHNIEVVVVDTKD